MNVSGMYHECECNVNVSETLLQRYSLSSEGIMDEIPLDEHVTGDQDLAVHCIAPEHKAFQLFG